MDKNKVIKELPMEISRGKGTETVQKENGGKRYQKKLASDCKGHRGLKN